MTRANTARHSGDEFQARVFWLKAANLLKPRDPIVEVAWETGPRGVDDIRVDYQPPLRSINGPVTRDYIQCKWHVGAGEFGYRDLISPKFTRGETYSWLQRAYDAFCSDDSPHSRFTLQTNWRIAADDPLFELVRKESNELNLQKLFSGKTARSKMGKVRKCWCDHLKIDDVELRAFAATLTFSDDVRSMAELRERLDDRLAAVGMLTIPTSHSAYIYDDLIIKLHKEGDVVLNDALLREICDRHNLWGSNATVEEPFTLGIRSFMHKFDSMEHRCHHMLDLVPQFDGRFLRPEVDWQANISPELSAFISKYARGHASIRIRIDAHASIAVAVGRLLDVKSGFQLSMEQRTSGAGVQYWSAEGDSSGPMLSADKTGNLGGELVVALSITHNVIPAVTKHCDNTFNNNYLLFDARLEDGPSGIGIKSGGHAWRIAEELSAQLRAVRDNNSRRIHLFAAAPNALMFFLGQQLGLGEITVYEWDFEGRRGGGYQPGLTLEWY